MYCVGLTGPIASGKSVVAALFVKLGAELIDADQIAKQLTAKDQPALANIIAHFGPEFLDSNGNLLRRLLRAQIFNNPQERIWLERLLHPLIRQEIAARLRTPPALYYIIEIPLLTDKQHYPYLNRTVVVLAEPTIQMARVMLRDNHTMEQVQAIVQAQADEKTYRGLADDLIMNNGSLSDLEQAVLKLHETYCGLLQTQY